VHEQIVITGIGVVSGLGVDASSTWDGLMAGRCALAPITSFATDRMPSRHAARAPDYELREVLPKHYRKFSKVMARDIELAVIAASEAVGEAGLVTRAHEQEATTYPNQRIGCQIGAGLIAAEIPELGSAASHASDGGRFDLSAWGEEGMSRLPPLWMLKYLPNMLACHVTILHGCEGPSNTLTCAEASGLLSLGESARVIERGDADACFSGGAETKLNPMGVLRLDRGRRLARGYTGPVEHAIRPYDPDAPGQMIGEMAGIMVLERASGASSRGAKALATLKGFGAGHSGRSLDTLGLDGDPPDEDEGLTGAIRSALRDAGIGPEDIDAIVPHAAGHPWLDHAEAGSLRAVFGSRLARIPLVTVPPAVGEGMAGMGAMLAVVGAMCVKQQALPARIHGGKPAPDLDAGPAPSRDADLGHVLVCSGSMGGSAGAIVLARA